MLGHGSMALVRKKKGTTGDPSPCEPQETLISKCPLEFLKRFTQEILASINERMVMPISTKAAFPATPEGIGLRAVFVIFVKKKSKKHNHRVGAFPRD